MHAKTSRTYNYYLQYLLCILGAAVFAACSSDEWTRTDTVEPTIQQPANDRPLVHHEVTVSIDNAVSRVGYAPNNDTQGLDLSWDVSETLGVYIKKTDNSIVYAGTVSSTGTAGDRGARRFSGTITEKSDDEHYIYIHPALTGETQGFAAQGTINYTTQSGSLGSTAHLNNYLPLIWNEGSTQATNHGYVLHLNLTFDQDPGTIQSVSLQTMEDVGNSNIFPQSFDASTMSPSAAMTGGASLTVTGTTTATQGADNKWHAEAYIACTHRDIDVFRTKFNVKVQTTSGSTYYYNEYRSFPGQQQATQQSGLPMLANGICYNLDLTSPLSKDVATTVINEQYKVNSLLGMWNNYGKTVDPFRLSAVPLDLSANPPTFEGFVGELPTHLMTNILSRTTNFTDRTLINKSPQGSPTFTWTMVDKQSRTIGIKQSDVTYNNIDIVDQPTEVFLTFISEYAWSQNLLGYYHYETGHAPASSNDVLKTIVFPNVSKGGHVPYNRGGGVNIPNVNPNTAAANVGEAGDAPLKEYTTVQLLYNKPDGSYSKEFPAGTTIGFFMMRDPKASSSGHDEGEMGGTGSTSHTNYQPRKDNTLIDWNSWRLFTNTAWNRASGNVGWWDMGCHNFFCSADVGNSTSGGVIPGLALYGAKDDASHNYNYSFSAMLFMVSTKVASSMKTANKCYFNIGTGNQIIDNP